MKSLLFVLSCPFYSAVLPVPNVPATLDTRSFFLLAFTLLPLRTLPSSARAWRLPSIRFFYSSPCCIPYYFCDGAAVNTVRLLAMMPGGFAGGTGAGADSTYGSSALATLYPACLGCRQQIDSLLSSIDKGSLSSSGKAPSTSSSPGPAGLSPAPCRREDGSRFLASRSSSSNRSTSSPAWSSGITATDTPGDGGNVATQQRLLALSQQLSRDVIRLCEAFDRERPQMSPQQVLLWQRRITGLRDDAASLSSAVQAEVGTLRSWEQDEHRQREELLQMRGGRGRSRFGVNRGSGACAMDSDDRATARNWDQERREEHATDLAWLREREKLQESGMMLETIFSQGRGVLDRVVQQNSVLRNARKKLMKVTSAAGVSSALVRAAARRQDTDRKLIFGGMVLTLLFFFLVYRFAHSFSFSSLLWPHSSPPTAGPDVLERAARKIPETTRG